MSDKDLDSRVGFRAVSVLERLARESLRVMPREDFYTNPVTQSYLRQYALARAYRERGGKE